MPSKYNAGNNYGGGVSPRISNTGQQMPRSILSNAKSPTYITDQIFGLTKPADGTVFGVPVVSGIVQGVSTNPYRVEAHHNANQTIGTSQTQVDFNTVDKDTNEDFASSQYVSPIDGTIHVTACIQVTATSGLAACYMRILVNGTVVREKGNGVSASNNTGADISSDVSVAVGDVVTIAALGNVLFTAQGSSPTFCWFNCHAVSVDPSD